MKPGEYYLDHDYNVLLLEVVKYLNYGLFSCEILFGDLEKGETLTRHHGDPALQRVKFFKLEGKWIIIAS